MNVVAYFFGIEDFYGEGFVKVSMPVYILFRAVRPTREDIIRVIMSILGNLRI
jgi:hypothetical protein